MKRDPERDEEDARFVAERLEALCQDKFGGDHTAFATAIGASPRNVQRWCKTDKKDNRATPSLSEVLKIPRATGVTLDELVGLKIDPAHRLASIAERADSMIADIHQALGKLLDEFARARADIAGAQNEIAAAERADRSREAAAEGQRRHVAGDDG